LLDVHADDANGAVLGQVISRQDVHHVQPGETDQRIAGFYHAKVLEIVKNQTPGKELFTSYRDEIGKSLDNIVEMSPLDRIFNTMATSMF